MPSPAPPRRCVFPGCQNLKTRAVSLFKFPSNDEMKNIWIDFVQKSHVDGELKITTNTRLCSDHFTSDCFKNFQRKQLGFTHTPLLLATGAVPSISLPSLHAASPTTSGAIAGSTSPPDSGTAGSFCRILPDVRHAASQTDPQEGISVGPQPSTETPTDSPGKRSVGTQLSMKTLQNRFRSTATQARVPSRDCGVCTLTFPLDSPLLFLQPTIVKRPSKRPRLSLSDEEEGPCSPYMVVQVPDDST
ncbi:THAP domain-containing protein 10-like isoform X1 [Sebastes umbrosus]|uniref:THAP domain-containing protein 10-like isoform X1 n=1 Tax=Sebastes umbrosus TaxID=72105 RepID=UPI00189FBA4A|nr:THAP domain-containing protein 10-like isoform X1 [Sebastes umbrosus]XP_037641807.1 THAP domain-containing protein 10-like isoform X1 [Sebastes umbrosus]